MFSPQHAQPSNQQPLLEEGKQPDWKTRAKKGCIKYCGMCALTIFVLVWIVQFACFWWATLGCGPHALSGYDYPGGGTSELGGPEFNLVPKISLLGEREPSSYGYSFDNFPSNEASSLADAPTGVWWRTWGPLFNTYVYEDVANSKITLYMRQNLLRLGMSHRIRRCDGKGPKVVFTEGSNWFSNRIRHLLGLNQGMTFKIWTDNEMVAIAQETNRGFDSITTRDMNGTMIASSILQDRHFHGQYDLWLVKNEDNNVLPYWVQDAATLLFAFNKMNQKLKVAKAGAPTPAPPPKYSEHPHFFAAVGNGTEDPKPAIEFDAQQSANVTAEITKGAAAEAALQTVASNATSDISASKFAAEESASTVTKAATAPAVAKEAAKPTATTDQTQDVSLRGLTKSEEVTAPAMKPHLV